jgi:RNA polymerase sigma factor (sigma-70 family)
MRARGQRADVSGAAGDRLAVAVSASGSVNLTKEDYLRIHPKLSAKIRRFGIRADQVEELVQETFLEAHKGLRAGQFNGESALDTWVISIGKHLCLKHHRAQNTEKRKAPEVAIELPSSEPADSELALKSEAPLPDRQAQDRELLARVLRVLGTLPATLREPLVLKARGHSYQQIARLLGITPNLVSARIHQARTELSRELPGAKKPAAR